MTAGEPARWGSDVIADALAQTGTRYITLTPGASFRGLHDSLVNHLGADGPELLLCIHEEHAVAIAHGYAKVTGEPMVAIVHSNVGLMHASMAVFNAYADRVPMLVVGADGPADAAARRPWIDWLHTSADLGSVVRQFVKWDDRPQSAAAAVGSIARAHQLTRSQPPAPVFVALEVQAQETRTDAGVLDQTRRQPIPIPEPEAALVGDAVTALQDARSPVILMGRVSRDTSQWDQRVRLAELAGAHVITSHKLGAAFPTDHRLHSDVPSLFLTPVNRDRLRSADVILSLDWVDLGGTLVQAFGTLDPPPTVIHASAEHHLFHGANKLDYAPGAVDIALGCSADVAVESLLRAWTQPRPQESSSEPRREPVVVPATPGEPMPVLQLQAALREVTAGHAVSLLRVPFAWNFGHWDLHGPLDYLGGDGGGGIGSGPGMAVGSALALKGTDRLPVAVLGDGDFLMGVTALWTAARYDIPLLVVVANNSSFFNDEIHQRRVAQVRRRPLENAHVGLRMEDPDPDLAQMARAQGWAGFGPIHTYADLLEAFKSAVEVVDKGGQALVDVRVARGYGDTTEKGVAGG